MSLRDGINKVQQDQKKLQNQAGSQAISPLTERVANNNTNPDSLKMSATQAARQGAMKQIAKDQTAVQNGALAQQQAGAAQQRQAQATGQSVADFQSEGIEAAQEAVNEKAQQWSQQMSRFGSLGNRVSTAVQEEMAAGGQVAQEFEVNQEAINQAVSSLATPGNEQVATDAINTILDSIQQGQPEVAIQALINNAQAFNVDTTTSGAALTQIFESLNIDPSTQQQMVTSAIVDGIVDPDNLTMDFMLNQGILTTDNDSIPELGMTVAEIEEMVGPEWREMTTAQIANELELSFDDEAERDDIMRELANPNIDPTRKAELQRELQMLDASGVTSAEEAAARGIDRTANADQVLMGGKLASVDEVLSDENIKAKSDDLLMKLQADPTNAAAVLEAWKAENPGYEGMGDRLKTNQEQLANAGETVQSAQEILDKKNKEASDFVNNNELFGATEGAKAILEELGFNTEGFGALGNDQSNPTYKALATAKEKYPDQFELFQQNLVNMDKEDLEGLTEIEDINLLIEVLGTKEVMQEFNFLRKLNNKLATTDTSDYAGVLGSILPEGHALRDLASDPEVASQYLADLNQMKELGVSTPELEALSALMDEDGDGNLDSPEDMAANIQELLGDGFNLGNFQSDEAKQIMYLINNTDKDFGSFIQKTTTAKNKEWEDTVGAPQREALNTATSFNTSVDTEQPWIKGGVPDVSQAYKNHPSKGKWKKTFDVGRLGPGHAQKAGAQVFTAMTNNPKLFESMPQPVSVAGKPVASKELVKWWKENIGIPNPKGSHSAQISSMIQNIARGGSDFNDGLDKLFGKDVDAANKAVTQYNNNSTTINNGLEKNPWSDF
jgi:hypothetical protein